MVCYVEERQQKVGVGGRRGCGGGREGINAIERQWKIIGSDEEHVGM